MIPLCIGVGVTAFAGGSLFGAVVADKHDTVVGVTIVISALVGVFTLGFGLARVLS